MPLLDVQAVILGGGRGTRLYPLTKMRTKPAVPIGGKYRLIDIAISNCINAGITRIFVLTQFLSASLNRHVHQTYQFDVFSGGTAEILAAALLAGDAPELLEGLDPNDPVMPFAELVAVWDEDSLVVGHQPFMSKAVCLLMTGNEEHAAVDFRPGSLVCLEREQDGPWGLAWMLRPELFPG